MPGVQHGARARASNSSRIVVNTPVPLGPALSQARDEAGWYPYQQTKWTPWDCIWTADVGFPPVIGDGILRPKYILKDGPTIDWKIYLGFGSTTNGGRGSWGFSLPFPTIDDGAEQNGDCKCFVTGGGNYDGFVYCPANAQIAIPYFPFNFGTSLDGPAQNADLTGAVGTGVPLVGGNFTWTNGTNAVLWGSYEPKL